MAKRQKQRLGKGKGRRSDHHKTTGKYVRQRFRTAKNKLRRLKKHLELHINDLLAKEALKQL